MKLQKLEKQSKIKIKIKNRKAKSTLESSSKPMRKQNNQVKTSLLAYIKRLMLYFSIL